jgi:arylsulfatase A-like enzyme
MIDWAPTLCDLAGCEMGPYPDGQLAPDGLSFAPLLVDAPYRYHRESILHTIPSGGDRPVFWSLRTTSDHPEGEWLYVENQDGFRELYDLTGDPSLLTNVLAGTPGGEAAALGEVLAAELAAKKAEVAPEPVVEDRDGT